MEPNSDPAGPHPDACFDADWLALRAAADSAARAPRLEALATGWLHGRRQDDAHAPLRLVDLGCGSGANPRHLAPRLPGPQRWTLLDHDPGLLAHACSRCGGLVDADGTPLRIDTRCQDLDTLEADTLAGADLVCASALLDLMPARWLAHLADACAQTGCALLITLSEDGSWRFWPRGHAPHAEDDDTFVRDAFNAHQHRDKGLGDALGPDAAPALAELLAARGFRVEIERSPWRLDLAAPPQAALARALVDGWRDAATAQSPHAAERIAAWHERRRAQCAGTGTGVLEVGHLDLFATPPATGPGSIPR